MVFGHDTLWRFDAARPRIELGSFVRFKTTPAGEKKGTEALRFLATLQERIKERQQTL